MGTLTKTQPIAEQFAKDTADHRMLVLHDDGLYRHLRFLEHRPSNDGEYRPKSSFYWFDLITWPGSLTVNGDCGTFTFSRITDMFEFFRDSRYGINPAYWAEKVQGGSGLTEYSPDLFRRHVMDRIEEAGGDWPGLAEAVERDFFGDDRQWDTEYEDGAREALNSFKYEVPGRRGFCEPFTFADAWEWDLRDHHWQFLWCCHAVQWGIGQYDRLPVAAEPAGHRLSWLEAKPGD